MATDWNCAYFHLFKRPVSSNEIFCRFIDFSYLNVMAVNIVLIMIFMRYPVTSEVNWHTMVMMIYLIMSMNSIHVWPNTVAFPFWRAMAKIQTACKLYKSNLIKFRIFLERDTICRVYKCMAKWNISINDYRYRDDLIRENLEKNQECNKDLG